MHKLVINRGNNFKIHNSNPYISIYQILETILALETKFEIICSVRLRIIYNRTFYFVM